MYRKLFFASIAAFLFVLGNAQAKTEYKTEKHTSADGKYTYITVTNDPLKARIYTLKNGLTVYLSVNKDAPRIQTMIPVRAGSKNDPSDATGLAHYLEHMLFKGTDKFGSLDYSKEKPLIDDIENRYEEYRHITDPAIRKVKYHQIDSVSGEAAKFAIANEYDKMLGALGAKGTNAFTWYEQTVYVNDIPSNQLKKWLQIEAERFRNPVLRLFHTELEAVYEEKNRGLDNDGEAVDELLMSELFKKHTYGTQTTIGTIEHLKNPSMRKIREYFGKNYIPNNMAICLSGDLDPDETIRLIDQAFSGYEAKPVPSFSFSPEDPITAPIHREILGPDPENVTIAFRFPGIASHDALVMSLIDKILSNNVAGLMDLDLNQKQKVLSSGTWAMEQTDYSVHYFFGSPLEGQKLEDVEKMILNEIDLVKQGKFDDALLPAIINDLTVQRIRGYENNRERANAMSEAFVHHLEWDKVASQIDDLSKITKKEIMEVANKYYGNNYVSIYKRIGQRNTPKVEKPAITPVSVNRDAKSEFLVKNTSIPADKIAPRFIDYKKDLEITKLKDGIPVHYLKNDENQLFTLYYLLDMGKRDDKKMAYALNYLNYLGTDKLTNEEFKKKLYSLGCSFGVSASDDQIYVYLSGLQKNFSDGVKLFEDLLLHAKPDKDALTAYVGHTLKERDDAKKDKGTILFSAMNDYGKYGKRNPFTDVLSESQLKSLTADELVGKIHDLIKYDHRILYYGPEGSKNVIASLDKLHQAPQKRMPIVNAPDYTYQETNENKVFFVNFDMAQAEILFLSKSFQFDAAKVPTQRLYNEYFGGGMASVVFQTIRESKALAYSVWSNFVTPPKKNEPNYVFAYVGTQADKLPETMDGMFDLFHNLPEADPIFQQSKEAIMKKIETERITRTGILFNYESAQKLGLDHDIRKDVYLNIPSMDFKTINDFQKKYIKDQHYTILALGSRDKIDMKKLAQYGPVKELSLEEVFGY
ncbi:MAG: insulinase family protein [Bacteroidota bacterium]|nr:insulinase family protein [Bacteroidota bacterium]MDP4231334.1 insulinase family protein [Bacteroidota bacterium]MDP4236522.1 insulinase family protein [Bacteroidota bacterium]